MTDNQTEPESTKNPTIYESTKKNAEIIANWYQSYYLWNIAFMESAMLSTNLALQHSKLMSIPYANNDHLSGGIPC